VTSTLTCIRRNVSRADSGRMAGAAAPADAEAPGRNTKAAKEEKRALKERERSRSLELQYLHRHAQSMQHLEQGGLQLASKFTLACGVRASSDVFAAARVFRKQKVREFWLYIVFLIIFSASTLQQRPVESTHDFISNIIDATVLGNGFTSVYYDKTIDDIGSVEDFWGWITEVLPQFLYQHEWYNGTAFGPDFRGTQWRVLQNNLVVQNLRMRQIRVLREDCQVPRRMSDSDFGGLLANGSTAGTNFRSVDGRGDCYPSIGSATIDVDGHWGLIIVNGTFEKRPLPYRTDEELRTQACNTRATTTPNTYEGGGYVQEFPLGLSNAQFAQMLMTLKDLGWTDRQTRCVFFDMAIYNLELNTFLNVRIAFEFQPHGFVMTYISKRAFRMGYVRARDQLLLGMDALVYGFVLINIANLCIKVRLLGKRFFSYTWNSVDVLNYIFFLIPLYYKIIYFNLTSPFIAAPAVGVSNATSALEDGVLREYDGSLDANYVDFEYAGWVYNMISLLNGFNSLFTWLKLFAYLRFISSQAEQFIETVSQAAANLTIFVSLLSVVLWAYAQTIFVSFGTDIAEYKTIKDAYVNTFKAMIEGYDIDALRASDEYLGSLLYISFLFIAFMVILNMFLAIIAKTYDDVNGAEVKEDPMAQEFREGLKASLYPLLSRPQDPAKVSPELAVQLAEAQDPENSSKDATSVGDSGGDGGGGHGGADGERGGGGGDDGLQNRVSFQPFSNQTTPTASRSAPSPHLSNRPMRASGAIKGGGSVRKTEGASGILGEDRGMDVEVEVPEEVLMGLLSAVRELSGSVRQVSDRLDALTAVGQVSASRLHNSALRSERRRGGEEGGGARIRSGVTLDSTDLDLESDSLPNTPGSVQVRRAESESPSLSLSLFLSFSLFLSLSLSFSFSLSLSHPLSLSLVLSLPCCVSLALSFSFSFSLSFALSPSLARSLF